jgi:hypothetical protein
VNALKSVCEQASCAGQTSTGREGLHGVRNRPWFWMHGNRVGSGEGHRKSNERGLGAMYINPVRPIGGGRMNETNRIRNAGVGRRGIKKSEQS